MHRGRYGGVQGPGCGGEGKGRRKRRTQELRDMGSVRYDKDRRGRGVELGQNMEEIREEKGKRSEGEIGRKVREEGR